MLTLVSNIYNWKIIAYLVIHDLSSYRPNQINARKRFRFLTKILNLILVTNNNMFESFVAYLITSKALFSKCNLIRGALSEKRQVLGLKSKDNNLPVTIVLCRIDKGNSRARNQQRYTYAVCVQNWLEIAENTCSFLRRFFSLFRQEFLGR